MVNRDVVKNAIKIYWVIDNDGRDLKFEKMIRKELLEFQKIINAWLN